MKLSKKILIPVSIALACVVIASAITVAFLTKKTTAAVNTFTGGYVGNEITETLENGVKKNVKIKNTGNIAAYVRVLVAVTWIDDNGNIYQTAPVKGVDYNVTMPVDSKWLEDTASGYFYCKQAVEAESESPVLFESITAVDGKAPSGYKLSVEILSSSIQSVPTTAVEEAWSAVTVSTNGELQLKGV